LKELAEFSPLFPCRLRSMAHVALVLAHQTHQVVPFEFSYHCLFHRFQRLQLGRQRNRLRRFIYSPWQAKVVGFDDVGMAEIDAANDSVLELSDTAGPVA